MASYAYDEETANEARGFSAFGGHFLTPAEGTVAAYDDRHVATLGSLGIEDAEQLLAIAAIPEVREELQLVLSLKDQDLQSLLDQAQAALPAERAALVSAPAPTEFGLGVLIPTAEMMAAAEASAAPLPARAVALPPSVNLIPYMSPIRNQASRGTCVSFALTALSEYILRRRGLIRDLSEQHLYYEIKLIDGASSSCGTWQVKAVTALQNRGECREVIWPYNPNPPCNNHGVLPAQARPDGLNYRLATLVVSPNNVLAYKTHMSLQRPVTLSIPVYNSWYQSAETRRSGRITMRIGNEPAVGGHAVCLVGYQDTPSSPGGGYFIVRNSWSTGWAYQSPYGAGYGTIPYQYITNDGWEAFTAPVPGIGTEDQAEEERDEDRRVDGQSTVTIQVGTNIKVTISAS
jgi:C1A family cysteine protease